MFAGHTVSALRALTLAVLTIGVGLWLAFVTDTLELFVKLVRHPWRFNFDWPVFVMRYESGGARYFYVNDWFFWLPIGLVVIGLLSLVFTGLDRLVGRRPPAIPKPPSTPVPAHR